MTENNEQKPTEDLPEVLKEQSPEELKKRLEEGSINPTFKDKVIKWLTKDEKE